MSIRDRILATLQESNASVCDDCLARRAQLSARQVSHSYCTALSRDGVINRGRGRCGICAKFKIINERLTRTTHALSPIGAPAGTRGEADAVGPTRSSWYWEGNVVSRLVSWLANRSYSIRSVADTAARSAGKDIVATTPDGKELWITVKGYPENRSNTQARHYFAGALLDVALYRSEGTDAEVAIALPDGFATYVNLAARITWLRNAVPFTIYWVDESGSVRHE